MSPHAVDNLSTCVSVSLCLKVDMLHPSPPLRRPSAEWSTTDSPVKPKISLTMQLTEPSILELTLLREVGTDCLPETPPALKRKRPLVTSSDHTLDHAPTPHPVKGINLTHDPATFESHAQVAVAQGAINAPTVDANCLCACLKRRRRITYGIPSPITQVQQEEVLQAQV